MNESKTALIREIDNLYPSSQFDISSLTYDQLLELRDRFLKLKIEEESEEKIHCCNECRFGEFGDQSCEVGMELHLQCLEETGGYSCSGKYFFYEGSFAYRIHCPAYFDCEMRNTKSFERIVEEKNDHPCE